MMTIMRFSNLNDLENAWCPAEDLINGNADVVPLSAAASMAANDDDYDSDEDSDSGNDSSATDETGSIRIVNMKDANLENVIDPSMSINLPSKIDCGAHTLNLIGKVDSFNAMSDREYSTQYVAVFSKLNSIWKHSSTRKGRELFTRYLNGKVILKPNRIRWNRIYDAVIILI